MVLEEDPTTDAFSGQNKVTKISLSPPDTRKMNRINVSWFQHKDINSSNSILKNNYL